MSLLKYAVLILGLASPLSVGAEGERKPLEDLITSFKGADQLCVGYKASKKVPLFGQTDVIGTNCADVTIQRKNRDEVQITVGPSFESGNGKRDRHVVGALGGDNKTPVVVSFLVESLKALPEKDIPLNGTISILGNETPIHALLSKVSESSYGVFVQTKFTEVKIERPQVGPFGVGGSVNDDLILFGQISAEKATILIQNKEGL